MHGKWRVVARRSQAIPNNDVLERASRGLLFPVIAVGVWCFTEAVLYCCLTGVA